MHSVVVVIEVLSDEQVMGVAESMEGVAGGDT